MHHYSGPGRSVAFAAGAMCATSHPLAAMTALDMLKQGGNAVDAAVAGAAVLGFCEPMMCGLGGDVFAMVRDPETGVISGLNGSGRAPMGLDAAMLREQGLDAIPLDSIHSVTAPGAVDAFDKLVRAYGRLDLAAVLQPAIHYAENGVPVCHRSALDWKEFGPRLQGAGRKHYLRQGEPYAAGSIFASPAQAEALRLVARHGRDAFYAGEIMQDMLDTLRAAGGCHTADDFANTAATEVEPIRINYHGHDLIELPPNGQGATALLLAKILKRFDISRLDPNGAERVHLEAEATRLAYGARDRFIGDAAGAEDRVRHMLCDETADTLADLIDPRRACRDVDQRAEALHRDTVYICVVDEDRLAVSLIYSTFWPFGSGLASARFGISFQNRGAGFSLQPGHVNELKGGRRPLHTLIPGFVEKAGSYAMPFGVMGGPFQATGHAHFLSNLVDFGMDIQEAIDGPRSFLDPATGKLALERGYSDDVAVRLTEMGHEVTRAPVGMGGAQAIRIDLKTKILEGGSDPRKDGLALGF
ncbi:gamma-glutamyltransferase family protein [Allomesorhizobium camelthorni]|uniref:Gamma-glutamyltransferase family protein n=1 Tax=Allomesorhizobium camelthorni TaxID=475069 RepID=A0A6G4WLL3_9HYPH|nr:gamma-glutamyltransferase family protein [Mesorhizobium camelthorni]NGO55000.1 gamma-glutamyltransferase family protein [Mesorhizobium camelthorni]